MQRLQNWCCSCTKLHSNTTQDSNCVLIFLTSPCDTITDIPPPPGNTSVFPNLWKMVNTREAFFTFHWSNSYIEHKSLLWNNIIFCNNTTSNMMSFSLTPAIHVAETQLPTLLISLSSFERNCLEHFEVSPSLASFSKNSSKVLKLCFKAWSTSSSTWMHMFIKFTHLYAFICTKK